MPNTDINPDDLTIDGEESYTEWLQEMANVIREKLDTDEQMKPVAFPSKMRGIPNNTGMLFKTSNASNSNTFEFGGIPKNFYANYSSVYKFDQGFSNASGATTYLTGDALEIDDKGFFELSPSVVSFRYCKKIGSSAFGSLVGSYYFPELEEIGSYAYALNYYSRNAFYLYAPKCKVVGYMAFGSYTNTAHNNYGKAISVNLGSPVSFGELAFAEQDKLTGGFSFDKAEYIGERCFRECYRLRVPLDAPLLSYLGARALEKCSQMSYAYLPNLSGGALLQYGFYSATGIEFIYLGYPSGTTSSALTSAFLGCPSCSIVLRNVYSLGDSVFASNSTRKTVYIWNDDGKDSDRFTQASNYTFAGMLSNDVITFYVPDFDYSKYISAPNWSGLKSRIYSLPEEEFKTKVKEMVDEVRGVDTPIWGDDSDDEATA